MKTYRFQFIYKPTVKTFFKHVGNVNREEMPRKDFIKNSVELLQQENFTGKPNGIKVTQVKDLGNKRTNNHLQAFLQVTGTVQSSTKENADFSIFHEARKDYFFSNNASANIKIFTV